MESPLMQDAPPPPAEMILDVVVVLRVVPDGDVVGNVVREPDGVVERDDGGVVDLPGFVRSGIDAASRGGHGGEVGRPRNGRGEVLRPLSVQRRFSRKNSSFEKKLLVVDPRLRFFFTETKPK